MKPQFLSDVRHIGTRFWTRSPDCRILILLEPFRPRNTNGHILLTSRASHFKGHLGIKQPIELRSLRPEDAVSFLFDRTNRKSEQETESERRSAAALAAQLGYFPLALEQAAAYIAAEDISFADYLADFLKREQELLNEAPPETGDYRYSGEQEYKTLRTTWDLNFRAVEQSNPVTAELLRFSAFLAPDDIPYWLIVKGARELGSPLSDVFANLQDEAELIRACDSLLKPLLRYSLVEKNRNEHTYNIHRMVQSVQRARLNTEQQDWVERAVCAVCAAFPYAEFANLEWCATLLPHALICLTYAREQLLETNETALLLVRSGNYLVELSLYPQAEPLYREALAIRQHALPEGHPNIATSLNNLAGLYNSQGRYEEAELLYGEASGIMIRALGVEHPNTQTVLDNYVGLMSKQGRQQQAFEFLQRLGISIQVEQRD